MNSLRLRGIRSIHLSTYFSEPARHANCRRIAFVTSGYERRSSYWTSYIIQKELKGHFDAIHVVGFGAHRRRLSRPANDRFYNEAELGVHRLDGHDRAVFVAHLETLLASERDKSGNAALEIHVDYSCMPRSWYCELPSLLNRALTTNEAACLWYTKGLYSSTQYPTAGVDDFRLFAGTPSLAAKKRTHVFGLGFDKIRSQAIWSVLDPKSLVCFFADRGARPEYVQKVRFDNAGILAASLLTFTVPIDDFVSAFSRIRAVILDLRLEGDVIIVPDGPKQLVLASSLVPLSIDGEGILCFHVRRRKDADIQIVDVEGQGTPSGFLMYGGRK
jgi:hypothetical protein